MERNKVLTLAMVASLGLVVWVVPCRARLVTVAITAEVTEETWSEPSLFQGKVQAGDTITGTYTYDTAENLISWGSSSRTYEFSSPSCGILLEVGGFTFQADPNNVALNLRLDNDILGIISIIDRFSIFSDQNLPLDGDIEVRSIELLLENEWRDVKREPFHPLLGLLSPALPAAAPDFRYWPTRELTIQGNGFTIVGQLTSAVLVQGPPKLIYVDDDAAAGGDGTSWANAYSILQDALADANAAEKPVEIRVAQGRYQPDLGARQVQGDREAAFALLDEVTLKGGYAGAQASDPNARNPQLYQTILTGDLLGDDLPGFGNRGDNSYHVTVALDTDESAVLDGFVVESGYADGLSDEGAPRREDHTVRGGGLYVDGGALTVRQCTFRDNYAYAYGGGARVGGLSLRICNSTFVGNTAGDCGGGLYAKCPGVLQGCLFQGNTASSGGAMLRSDHALDLYIVSCTVADNRAFEGTPMRASHPGYVDYAIIYNSILWNPPYEENCTSLVHYSDVRGETGGRAEAVLNLDPCFAARGYWTDPNDLGAEADPNDPSAVWIAGDYHLKSQAGHWDTGSQGWVLDEVTSPCIDAGDPASLIDDEPVPNGARINMGAYGGTPEASKSYPEGG